MIRLAIPDEPALRQAFAEVSANALRHATADRINGVLVQPMVPAGVEMMIGIKVDPLFGPLLVVGLGGVMVELLRDTAVMPAPVTRREALEMLQGLKGAALLKGFRGSAPVDLERLAEIVCRVGEFAADHAVRIVEADINPLICAGSRLLAVDALICRETPRH